MARTMVTRPMVTSGADGPRRRERRYLRQQQVVLGRGAVRADGEADRLGAGDVGGADPVDAGRQRGRAASRCRWRRAARRRRPWGRGPPASSRSRSGWRRRRRRRAARWSDLRLAGVLVLGDLLGRFGADRDPRRLHRDRPRGDRDADPGRRLRPRFVGVLLGAAAGSSPAPARRGRSPPRPLCLSHDPSGRNLAEGQVDYASRNAIFTYGQLRAGLRLAAQDRQGDRAVNGGDARSRRSCRPPSRRASAPLPAPPGRSAAGRAGAGSACPGSAVGRRSPGRCSSPSRS